MRPELAVLRLTLQSILDSCKTPEELVNKSKDIVETIREIAILVKGSAEPLNPVYTDIENELEYAKQKYGHNESKNTINDWMAYIMHHTGRALIYPMDYGVARTAFVKVAGLAISAIKAIDNGTVGNRHYD